MMSDVLNNGLIYPGWPAPAQVKAVMTTREGGVSAAPFDSLNVGDHVDDDPVAVYDNRKVLIERCQLPSQPVWLSQVHGPTTLKYDLACTGDAADAIVANQHSQVCAVMTADCLPVLFCNKQGTVVGAAHAGWRGLEAGILESTLSEMQCPSQDVLVWLGAAIGPNVFEVGSEVRQAFMAKHPETEQAFRAHGGSKWLADIYALARIRLHNAGIRTEHMFGGEWCTYSQSEQFYSYRREPRTGRMVSLIWLNPRTS